MKESYPRKKNETILEENTITITLSINIRERTEIKANLDAEMAVEEEDEVQGVSDHAINRSAGRNDATLSEAVAIAGRHEARVVALDRKSVV